MEENGITAENGWACPRGHGLLGLGLQLLLPLSSLACLLGAPAVLDQVRFQALSRLFRAATCSSAPSRVFLEVIVQFSWLIAGAFHLGVLF